MSGGGGGGSGMLQPRWHALEPVGRRAAFINETWAAVVGERWRRARQRLSTATNGGEAAGRCAARRGDDGAAAMACGVS